MPKQQPQSTTNTSSKPAAAPAPSSRSDQRPAIDTQGVDRKQLALIKKRFLQVNNARLARTKSALGSRRQGFLELLPMLLQVNHPILPGYVSHQTPCGIDHFDPCKRDIQRTQRLARSFIYRRQPGQRPQLQGIFLMGSCGTVAQSERSDLDIWVCHQPGIEPSLLLELKQKCEQLSLWAAGMGLEAHCFLMDSDKFKRGEREGLSGEDCGSSQHFLLLDEFYRTGLLIAGRIPIWWLVPPEAESHYDHYTDTLRDKRFVRADDTLDFGSVGQIPAGEFVGAGIWQLYKGIDSPYKSALKILLSEVYADAFPKIEALSTSFKQAIYRDQLDIDELDPYVMVLRKLERYLQQRDEPKRLELIRRCFYFKVGKPVTRANRNPVKSWQRQLLEKLVQEWQWSPQLLQNLDARDRWKVTRVIAEQQALVRELTNSYRFLLDFARRSQATAMINSHEMTILGRKLYATFERKAGKVEWVNPGISPNLAEESLYFYPLSNDHAGETDAPRWAVSSETLTAGSQLPGKPLQSADHLLALLSWCHFNGLLDKATRISCQRQADGDREQDGHRLSEQELQQIIRSLQQSLPKACQYTDSEAPSDERDRQNFLEPMRPLQLQLFINVASDPLAEIHRQGIERLSDRTDSLDYSAMRANLVLNIEQVQVNSWGELTTRRYRGDRALLRCLRDYLQTVPPGQQQALPQLQVHCFCPSRALAIARRVEELFRDIAGCFYSGTHYRDSPPSACRYLLQMQNSYYLLQFKDGNPQIEQADSYRELLALLAQPLREFSPLVLDRYCEPKGLLATIADQLRAGCVQVFYRHSKQHAEIYVADERGTLCHSTSSYYDERSFLSSLDQFIQSIRFRQSSEQGDTEFAINSSTMTAPLEYYEVRSGSAGPQLLRRNPVADSAGRQLFQVQAIGDIDSDGRLLFSIFCDQQEFSERQLGAEIYNTAARFILSRRKSGQRYPCYITDIDLSRCQSGESQATALTGNPSTAGIQTSHYLRYKQRLEQSLNRALQNL